MAKPRISIVCGTRPEIIKLAPVYHALVAGAWAEVDWIHTGQHGHIANEVYECFRISPTLRLNGHHDGHRFAGWCRVQLDELFAQRPSQMCVVQGDSESAFMAAMAAHGRRVPIAHVEAGLRTYNLDRPFPEEALRQMIARLALIHFAPTHRACDALVGEGVPRSRIRVTGNTVVDAQQWAAAQYGIAANAAVRRHILVSLQRREHWGADMDHMLQAIADIAREHAQIPILFPVPLHPAIRVPARRILSGLDNVRLSLPLGYVDMQRALADSLVVLTDSGGLQEEAPTWGVPVLVLREETERPEAVDSGCAIVVGVEREHIVSATRRLLSDELTLRRVRQIPNPYGDGRAAPRIAQALRSYLCTTECAAA